MSSVSRFLRQRQTGQTILGNAAGETFYVMIPGSGNYVGNYPNSPYTTTPGWVVASTPALPAGSILRDMGKTIFAAVSSSATTAPTSAPGYFREVQILNPVSPLTPISVSTSGVGLGMNGTGLPGVLPNGGNAGDAGYNTYYIPIVVNGQIAAAAGSATPLTLSAAGIRVGEQL